ncbi:MAG: hypothetical protein V5A32_01095 [Halovenus sp.]
MDHWRRRSRRFTWVLLFASATLILPALLGSGATVPLAAALASFAGALGLLRERLATLPTVVGYDLGLYGRDCWIGAAVGSAITLAFLGASSGELRALGGLAGLVGMVNYFLRPLYLYVATLLSRSFRSEN